MDKIKRRRFLFSISIIFVGLIALGIRFWTFFSRPTPIIPKQNVYRGLIDADPEDKDRSQVFSLKLSGGLSGKLPGTSELIRVRVYAPRYPRYEYGDEIEISGNLSPPRNFKSDNDRVFDYQHFLMKDDVFAETKNPKIKIIGHGKGSIVVATLIKIKRGFLSNITSVLGEPHAALAGGLVVGEKSALGKDLIDDFRRSGLIHIVVLSGFNITIVAAAIRRMLSFLPKRAGIVVGGTAMILFCILVGGGATVVRSCAMAIIALSAELFNRKYNVSRALALAAYFMLWNNPNILLYDPSFQLSFLATLALILLASPIEKILEKRFPKVFPEAFGIRGLVASTLATQIFVSPFIFYLMGQISIVGVFVNILVLPIIPLTMFVITAIGLGGFIWHVIPVIFAFPSHILLSYELWVVHFAAHLPFAVFVLSSFSFTTMCCVYAGYACLGLYFNLNKFAQQTKIVDC